MCRWGRGSLSTGTRHGRAGQARTVNCDVLESRFVDARIDEQLFARISLSAKIGFGRLVFRNEVSPRSIGLPGTWRNPTVPGSAIAL